MLNFPDAPTGGQTFGNWAWASSVPAWVKQQPVQPPNDGNEYVRINGLWRLKTERKLINGSAATQYAFNVPAGAKRGRYLGVAHYAAATGCQYCMRVNDGTAILTAATAYNGVGWLHNTGSSGFQAQAYFTQAQHVLTATHDNISVPNQFEGYYMTARESTAQTFTGQSRAYGYNSAAANNYMIFGTRQDLTANATASLTLTQLVFFGNAAPSILTESWIEMEWFY